MAGRKRMKAITRRLRMLENRLGPPVETQFDRQLRARIEAGRRRVAQWQEQERISVRDQNEENLSGLSITEILHRGRARALTRAVERQRIATYSEAAILGSGNSPCCSCSLTTITTKKTRHLSQPPSQHTRQFSMQSPNVTGLRRRRNLV